MIHFYSNSDTCNCLSFLCWNFCACTSGVNNYYSLLFKFLYMRLFKIAVLWELTIIHFNLILTHAPVAGIFVAVL